ncbi:hypothetical protein DH2020_004660 [Rehmannia glutinosa]|uniref:Uncharacterized protein n=1 Tax=Rehmannia glutinosa TaxID=99300 RepID=A0ABR0XQR8_REHGL
MAMVENGESEYTEDGTVDLIGNPVLRSKRGGWTACSFVVVYEIFERMSYCGISANLVLYLTKKLHQGTVTASNNVTYWIGAVWMTPILGAYVADAHFGRYWTFLIASAIYFMGMCLLTLAVSVPGLRPPPCNNTNASDCPKATTLELAVFYSALYILAIGTGGTKPNISTIGADQFDDFDPKEKAQKLSFFNWWMFSIFIGILFGNTVLVYIQDNVGWALGYGIPTAGLAFAITVFLIGTPFYRHKKPNGSPFTGMARVIVAALRKWKVHIPQDSRELHEFHEEVYTKKGKFKLESTTTLRNQTNVKNVTNFILHIPSKCDGGSKQHSIHQARLHTRQNYGTFQAAPASLGAFVTHGLVENGAQLPLTIFILLPQFVLMGVADACAEVAKLEFFYDQAPERLNGHKGWILDNLNESRLDLYFAFLAVLSFLNYIVFLVIVMSYGYKAEVSDSMEVLKEELEGVNSKNLVELAAE